MGSLSTEGPVYFCEDVSRIEFTDGMVYLTDNCGGREFTRAMRLSTFSRCVRGAYVLLCQIEQQQGDNIVPLQGAG